MQKQTNKGAMVVSSLVAAVFMASVSGHPGQIISWVWPLGEPLVLAYCPTLAPGLLIILLAFNIILRSSFKTVNRVRYIANA